MHIGKLFFVKLRIYSFKLSATTFRNREHRSGWTLPHVIACCLTIPSYQLTNIGLSPVGSFLLKATAQELLIKVITETHMKLQKLKIKAIYTRRHWGNQAGCGCHQYYANGHQPSHRWYHCIAKNSTDFQWRCTGDIGDKSDVISIMVSCDRYIR